ncbi:MAG: hypothetical protein KGL40_10470 [Rhodocyclaceae bacterium]|nr:hypothetical protein [Rhodocyclaceae bacterium]
MRRIDAELLLLEGVAAARRAEPGTAARCWAQILEASADADLRTQAYFNLGQVCRRNGDMQSAAGCFEHALAEDGQNHEAREQLALMQAQRGELAAAAAELQRLVSAQAEARHCFNLGTVLARQGMPGPAESAYRQGLLLLPGDAVGLGKVGAQLAEGEMEAGAVHCLAQAAAALNDPLTLPLAAIHNQLDAATFFLERAADLAPENAVFHYELASLRVEQRRLAEAESGFRRALQLDPACHRAAMGLAHVLLGQGRAEGWGLRETRLEAMDRNAKFLRSSPPTPRWGGESLRGKVLLLRQEQGFGDEIQFIRYLSRLRAMQPARIFMQCHPALHALLAGLPGLELLTEAATLPHHDFWISTLSLPLYCGGADIPADIPYLHAPAACCEHWAALLGPAQGRLRVGLLWQGNSFHINDRQRSLSSLGQLAPLWEIEGVDFFSLQREAVDTALPLRQFCSEITDFAEAAGLMSQLDLVLSVDSAYAHLAGALGLRAWVLLSAVETDWRWAYAGETTSWYPGMRLFRQTQRGDWAGAVAAAGVALRRLRDALPSSAGHSP